MNPVILDNYLSRCEIEACNEDWPSPEWPGWVNYDPIYHCKRASNLKDSIPQRIGAILAKMALLPTSLLFQNLPPLIPDLSLVGSGLHEMPSGPGLARHLDADTHVRLGLERVLSAVLWVHLEWRREWGGRLCLESFAQQIDPMPGRLAIFDCRNEYHWVDRVHFPDHIRRRSLAMFFYSANPGKCRRLRADFGDAVESNKTST